MPDLSARQIGTPALLLIGVASAEQPISAFMAQNALEGLNAMLDSWSVERLLTFTRPKRTLALVLDQQDYTWGVTTPPAAIPGPPPVRLELATLLVDPTPPGLEWPVEVLDQTQYEAGVWQKALQSSYVEMVYLEASQPVAVLHCWPVPTLPATLYLFPWQASMPYAAWDDVISWPNGYQRALQYNLAVDLAPQYGVEPSPTILRIAEDSKRAIFPINVEVGRLSLTPGRPRGGTPYGYTRHFLTGR